MALYVIMENGVFVIIVNYIYIYIYIHTDPDIIKTISIYQSYAGLDIL